MSERSKPWSIVVAAGSGTRFGSHPKQLASLAGRRVIDWAIAALAPVSDGVIVVGSEELGTAESLGVTARVAGGATRSDSVRCGLTALPAGVTNVLVHDSARPLVSSNVVARVVDALDEGAMAVVPVVPVVDTLRLASGGPANRDEFVAVQTPQGFDVELLRAVHSAGKTASDDASLIESSGAVVRYVEGDPTNIKVTFPDDLAIAEVLLATRSDGSND